MECEGGSDAATTDNLVVFSRPRRFDLVVYPDDGVLGTPETGRLPALQVAAVEQWSLDLLIMNPGEKIEITQSLGRRVLT